MKTILHIITIAMLLQFIISCRKEHRYPEDPKNSHQTPQERLNGNWALNSYTFNGNNIIEELNLVATNGYDINQTTLSYTDVSKHDADYELGDRLFLYPSDQVQFHTFDDYNYLKIKSNGCSSIRDSLFNYWFISPKKKCGGGTAVWEVTKLYKNDFHIVLNTDSGQFKITFIKKS